MSLVGWFEKAFIIWCIQGIMDDKIILNGPDKADLKKHFLFFPRLRQEDSMLELAIRY